MTDELTIALLASSETVAVAVAAKVGVPVEPVQRRHPEVDFRDHDGRTPHPAFEAALARYLPADEPPKPLPRRRRWPP